MKKGERRKRELLQIAYGMPSSLSRRESQPRLSMLPKQGTAP